ncbi:hypothetical protein P879_00552 [Paragonimus westermani]|uniref:EGF-like domain-containing protein n=1 Tax=Paragonimus westermani TaxID=34504 RepID=A0A8T0E0R3_9TREM|nr:hypothetical protein P879_00552 [Paragonimus westermani]
MDNIGDILVLLTLTAMRCGQLNGQMHSATLQPSGDLAPIRSNWTRSASTNITQGGRLFTVSPPVLFKNPSFDNFLTAASQMDTLSNRVLELNLLPACVPPCRNGGFCRKDEKQNTYFCLCPQDYTGSTCEMSETTPLESCDDYTCKNGGICVGSTSQPNCSCPTEVMGKFCERREYQKNEACL